MFSGNGQVSQVSEKPYQDKWGKNITLYSFQIAGDNSWYRTGTNRPNCNQGDMIQFVFEQQGNNKKVDPNSIQPVGGGQPNVQQPMQQPMQQQAPQQQMPQQRASNPAPQGNSRDDYWKNKEAYDKEVTQPRISYAAAQKSAVAVVTAALAHDVIGFGSAKKADKMEMLIGYVDEVTKHFAAKLDAGHEIVKAIREEEVAPQIVDEDDLYAA